MALTTDSNSPSNVNFQKAGAEAISAVTEALNPVKNLFGRASKALSDAASFGLGAAITAVTDRESFVARTEEIAGTARAKVAEGIARDSQARADLVATTKQWVKDQIQDVRDGVTFHANDIRASVTNSLIQKVDTPLLNSINKLPVTDSTKTLLIERYQQDAGAIKATHDKGISDLSARTAREEVSLEDYRTAKLEIQKDFATAYTSLAGTFGEAVSSLDHSARKQIRRFSEADRENGRLPDFSKMQIGKAISEAKKNSPNDTLPGIAAKVAPLSYGAHNDS